MMAKFTLAAVSLVLTVVFTSPAFATDAPAPASGNPDADQMLRQMSDKLSAARQFSFAATREIDPALMEG
jgi:hypothetical protein